jgi:hypothetical protein
MADRYLAPIGKARLSSRAWLALDHRDLMPSIAQKPGARDAYNAGAKY